MTLLDQFHSGQYLILEGNSEIVAGQILSIKHKFLEVLEVTCGERGRIGVKVCPAKNGNPIQLFCRNEQKL